MTRLSWGTVGEHYYEIGVDRGVLYVDGIEGVPWNGLIAVDENSSGGGPKATYLDGIKINNRASAEEYTATIHAYTSPVEFDEVDGTVETYTGLFATNQRRKPFGLTYRTKVGNDVDGIDHGYKIHLVYNALAAPSPRSHSSIGGAVAPATLSWQITTTPPKVMYRKPTSHFIVDSLKTGAEVLARLEDILYGSDTVASSLPTVGELFSIFAEYAVFIVTITGPETFTMEGSAVQMTSPTSFSIEDDSVVDNGDGSYSILDVDTPTTYATYDGGTPSSIADTILDGGTP